MKVLVLGGGASLEALIGELRSRGDYEFTVVGASGESVDRLDVATVARPIEVADRLATIVGAVRGRTGEIGWDDPVWELIDEVAASEAVVIAGGNGLASGSPALLAERLLVARLAVEFTKPLVLSGQMVGPLCNGADGAIVAEIMSGATLVGVCDQMSFDIVTGDLEISPDVLRRTLDDATFAVRHEVDESPSWAPDDKYLLADLTGLALFSEGEAAPALAELLRRAVELTGGELAIADPSGSAAACTEACAALSMPHRVLDVNDESLVAIARQAALVITGGRSVCQAAVLAQVPTLAVSADGSTDRFLDGFLRDFGLIESVVPAAAVVTGDAADVLERIVTTDVGQISSELAQRREAEAASWWDEVHATLSGGITPRTQFSEVAQSDLLSSQARPRIASLSALQRGAAEAASTGRRVAQAASEERAAAAARIFELESELGQVAADRDAAVAELPEFELALRAAHELAVPFDGAAGPGQPWRRAAFESRPSIREADAVARRASRRLARMARRGYRRLFT